MKYQSSNTKKVYDIDFDRKRIKCPDCSQSRRKEKQRDLQYYSNDNRGYCWHCLTTFFEYKPYDEKKYTIPEWQNITKLSDKAVKWFTSRMIKQETLNYMKVYTTNEFMPQFNKEIEVICFPYFRDLKLVNIKFRGANKTFKLVSGAELIFWNLDILTDCKDVIITEGEIDCLTFIENGFKNVVSVPNGANGTDYLDNYIHLFDDKDIYLSIDNDTKGIELRDELIRRFGAERCYLISFNECKDANDYFIKYGGIEFKDRVTSAKQIKIKGMITIDDLYNDIIDLYKNGINPGLKINNPLDEFITWEAGRLCIVTGIPSSGKSEFVDFVVSKLNILYGWKAAYFTPENYPLKYHYAKLHEKFWGREFRKSGEYDIDSVYEHIKDNFFYILDEEDMTFETVLNSAKMFVKQKGIKIFVIDPYNKLEHERKSHQTETEYVSKFLDKLINFAKFNNILVFLIAHPVKMQKGEIPTLYNISGSANFYNKTDYGITIHRVFDEQNIMTNQIQIHIQKIKFKNLGNQGVVEMKYNYNNGRFETKTIDSWDNSNWLIKEEIQQNIIYTDEKKAPF